VQVTDDLFDEIAQEVMDEDEQRLLEGLTFSCGIFGMHTHAVVHLLIFLPYTSLRSWHFSFCYGRLNYSILLFTFLIEISNQNIYV